MDSAQSDKICDLPPLAVRLLGQMTISRKGETLILPRSRKVRALPAYLFLAPRVIGRSQLCDLLWDVPDDPRSELRWCLSKIRSIVDTPGQRRIISRADTIRLDLANYFVDVVEIAKRRAGC
jgi:DNA-binding SARP family transcriptional activator